MKPAPSVQLKRDLFEAIKEPSMKQKVSIVRRAVKFNAGADDLPNQRMKTLKWFIIPFQ